MPDINDAFPSNYLKASDLGDDNVLVTIDVVKFEEFDGDNGEKERRPIVYFRGKKKGLVLNKTNARKIADLLQESNTDRWNGGQIKLYATETTFQGRATPCIRVKQAALPTRTEQARYPPPPPVEEREPGMEDDTDIPF